MSADRLLQGVRFILVLAAWLGATLASAETAIRSIQATHDSDAYVVDAVMFAPVPPSLAWEVLTDFDHMDRFAPNVKMSKVLTREGNRVTIEQRGIARFGALSFPYVSERELELSEPNSIRSKQTKGNMKRVESLMKFSPEAGGTRLNYHMELVPSLLASGALSTDFLKHEIEEQFNALIAEMVRRRQ